MIGGVPTVHTGLLTSEPCWFRDLHGTQCRVKPSHSGKPAPYRLSARLRPLAFILSRFPGAGYRPRQDNSGSVERLEMAEDTVANPSPPEGDDHADGRLMHDLAVLNTNIARYLFRFMDADAGRIEQIAVGDERQLAGDLSAMAEQLEARADRHTALCPSPLTIEGDLAPGQLTNGTLTERP